MTRMDDRPQVTIALFLLTLLLTVVVCDALGIIR